MHQAKPMKRFTVAASETRPGKYFSITTFEDIKNGSESSLISEYIFKYMKYWEKTLGASLRDYNEDGKFLLDFSKWLKKENEKNISQKLQELENFSKDTDGQERN